MLIISSFRQIDGWIAPALAQRNSIQFQSSHTATLIHISNKERQLATSRRNDQQRRQQYRSLLRDRSQNCLRRQELSGSRLGIVGIGFCLLMFF